MQSLCTLRNHCHQRPRNTRYQADATPYLGRTCTGWITPACGWRTYSITSWARPAIAGSRDKFVQQSRQTFRNDPRSVRRASGQLTPELRLRRPFANRRPSMGFLGGVGICPHWKSPASQRFGQRSRPLSVTPLAGLARARNGGDGFAWKVGANAAGL